MTCVFQKPTRKCQKIISKIWQNKFVKMKENKICKQLLTNFLETWKMSENDLHDMTK